jgi:protein-L-isoaspartate(D-aspartate) O-methyltransferase
MAPRILASLLGALMTLGASEHASGADDRFAQPRARMVAEIASHARETASYTGRATFDARVMAAMGKVERHRFVPPDQLAYAYENRPLPIGAGQTISQPYIVALMTDVLDLKPTDKVLEIGTGSGYQAAVLAELVDTVHTIEIVPALGQQAETVFQALGYRNIRARIGDGYAGWPEAAPFDAIVVTAAPREIPEALVSQLKAGGRMVVPVGPAGATQELLLIEKRADGKTSVRRTLPVRFVPMTGSPAAR